MVELEEEQGARPISRILFGGFRSVRGLTVGRVVTPLPLIISGRGGVFCGAFLGRDYPGVGPLC